MPSADRVCAAVASAWVANGPTVCHTFKQPLLQPVPLVVSVVARIRLVLPVVAPTARSAMMDVPVDVASAEVQVALVLPGYDVCTST